MKVGAATDTGNGTYTATLTSSTTVHPVTITASDSSVTPAAVGRATLTLTRGPATTVTVTLSPASIVADGKSTSTASMTVKDAMGHPAAGDRLILSATDSGVRFSAVTDHGNGSYSAKITTSKTVHQVTITASDSSVTPAVRGVAILTQTRPGLVLDVQGPVVTFGSAFLVAHNSRVVVTIRCPKSQSYCDGTVALSTRSGRRTIALGSARFHVAGGRSSAVKIVLSGYAMRRLGAVASERGTITAVARDKARRRGTARRSVTLRLAS